MENPLRMAVLIGESPINGPFSIAMFDYRRANMEKQCETSPCFIGKSTISMVMFNSGAKLPEGSCGNQAWQQEITVSQKLQ